MAERTPDRSARSGLEALAPLREARPRRAAHADHRQPVRDDGLRPPAPPRRLRAAGPLRGRRGRHRGARARDRAVPRGRARGLRRRRRVRRRRHRQRGRQRPARLAHAADLPARRLGQRVTARCSASPATSSTPPSTCSRSPTTGARARSTSASSTAAASRSPPASASTRASSSASTRSPRLKARSAHGTSPGPASDLRRATSCARRGSRPSSAARASARRHARSCRTATPFTYFGDRPIDIAEGAALDGGALAGVVLRRATPARRALDRLARASRRASRAPPAGASASADSSALRVRSADGRPLPLQVDGDYLGESGEAVFVVEPRAMLVVA